MTAPPATQYLADSPQKIAAASANGADERHFQPERPAMGRRHPDLIR